MTTTTFHGKTVTTGIAASAILGGLAAIILAIVWGGFWNGLVVSVLWAWFVVPVFGLPALTIAYAYGLALLARIVTHPKTEKKDKETFGSMMAKAFFAPPLYAALFLLVGYVVKIWT